MTDDTNRLVWCGQIIDPDRAEGAGMMFSAFASEAPAMRESTPLERALGALYFAHAEMECVAEGIGWEELEALLHAARKEDRELRAAWSSTESDGE